VGRFAVHVSTGLAFYRRTQGIFNLFLEIVDASDAIIAVVLGHD